MSDAGGPGSARKCPGLALADLGDTEGFEKDGEVWSSRDAFQVILDQLLIGEINWARVLSIVALSGSLAVQCAEKGEEKMIDLIRDWTASFAVWPSAVRRGVQTKKGRHPRGS